MAEGRTNSNLLEVAKKGAGDDKSMVMRRLIGSRAPKCDRMCSSCGHREAILVPIDTDKKEGSHFTAGTLN